MRYVEFLTHLCMAVIAQNKAYVLHLVECTEVYRRNKKLKYDMTFVDDLYGNELAKFGKEIKRLHSIKASQLN